MLNNEPALDSAAGQQALQGLNKSEMVVTLSPFKTNLDISDVLLPIAPFTETSGSFVNAEGRVQSFHAVVKPLGETRPAWKVLRVLAPTCWVSRVWIMNRRRTCCVPPSVQTLHKCPHRF